jgi:hypothetical protein
LTVKVEAIFCLNRGFLANNLALKIITEEASETVKVKMRTQIATKAGLVKLSLLSTVGAWNDGFPIGSFARMAGRTSAAVRKVGRATRRLNSSISRL